MKKLLFCLCAVFGLFTWFFVKATQAVPVSEIRDDEIYIFVQQGCRHCMAAENFLKDKYPNLNVQLRDISEERHRKIFFGCGAKFGLSKLKMGTPLFCMGQHYILGWDQMAEKQFESYVKDFLPHE